MFFIWIYIYCTHLHIVYSPQEAVDWILSLENIIPDGVGVIGTSKGGDIALALAMFSTKVGMFRPFCAMVMK